MYVSDATNARDRSKQLIPPLSLLRSVVSIGQCLPEKLQ
ncbi:hypothetical protein SynA18461_01975 [Synechococcus sp. A18-46.1]|nr:hypothetical protein SynA18461_01975 [Synechococcus sp. A18-46.1]